MWVVGFIHNDIDFMRHIHVRWTDIIVIFEEGAISLHIDRREMIELMDGPFAAFYRLEWQPTPSHAHDARLLHATDMTTYDNDNDDDFFSTTIFCAYYDQ